MSFHHSSKLCHQAKLVKVRNEILQDKERIRVNTIDCDQIKYVRFEYLECAESSGTALVSESSEGRMRTCQGGLG